MSTVPVAAIGNEDDGVNADSNNMTMSPSPSPSPSLPYKLELESTSTTEELLYGIETAASSSSSQCNELYLNCLDIDFTIGVALIKFLVSSLSTTITSNGNHTNNTNNNNNKSIAHENGNAKIISNNQTSQHHHGRRKVWKSIEFEECSGIMMSTVLSSIFSSCAVEKIKLSSMGLGRFDESTLYAVAMGLQCNSSLKDLILSATLHSSDIQILMKGYSIPRRRRSSQQQRQQQTNSMILSSSSSSSLRRLCLWDCTLSDLDAAKELAKGLKSMCITTKTITIDTKNATTLERHGDVDTKTTTTATATAATKPKPPKPTTSLTIQTQQEQEDDKQLSDFGLVACGQLCEERLSAILRAFIDDDVDVDVDDVDNYDDDDLHHDQHDDNNITNHDEKTTTVLKTCSLKNLDLRCLSSSLRPVAYLLEHNHSLVSLDLSFRTNRHGDGGEEEDDDDDGRSSIGENDDNNDEYDYDSINGYDGNDTFNNGRNIQNDNKVSNEADHHHRRRSHAKQYLVNHDISLLSHGIRIHPTLQSLHICGNYITDDDLYVLLPAITITTTTITTTNSSSSSSLQTLNLSLNKITNVGVKYISTLLSTNVLQLKCLYLDGNPFTNPIVLQKALQTNVYLEECTIPQDYQVYQKHIQYYTRLNRGGRRYVIGHHQHQRQEHQRQEQLQREQRRRRQQHCPNKKNITILPLPIELWPFILSRANHLDFDHYPNSVGRAEVIFCLLSHGPLFFPI